MQFQIYKNIDNLLYKKQKKNDIYALKLLKADKLFTLRNFKKSKQIVNELLDECSIEDITFNTLIKLSFLFGEFDKILRIIEKREKQFLSLSYDFFYIEVVNKYYKALKNNDQYPAKQLLEKANDNIKKSLLYYICFLLTRDEQEKKEFLHMSYKEENLNMSAIQELIKLGENIRENSLKFAFEIDTEVLNEISFSQNIESLNLKFLTFSGGNSIGGSSYIIVFEGLKIMIDAGAIMSKGNTLEYPKFQDLQEECEENFEDLDYLIITHGHLDHCGAILEVYKKNPKIKILITEETREIIRANLTSGKLSSHEEIMLDTCLNMAAIVSFRQPLKLKHKDSTIIEFFRAGHILGASSIYINRKNIGVFVTGDYCLYDQETVKGMDIPKDYKIDLLITETTYGNKINEKFTSRSYEEQEFIYTVKEALKSGKKILLPSFSIGGAQEIISILRKYLNPLDNERLYIDGMVTKINKIYERFLDVQFKGNNIYSFDERLYSNKKEFIEQEILNNKSCVVASSGMMQKGSTVMEYAKEFLKREDCVCILTGYQAEDTIGSILKSQMNLKANRYISIDQELIKIQCELKEANLSAHCSVEEILTLITKVKPRKVLLVHGNVGENQSYLHQLLNKCSGLEVIQTKNNSIINI